MGDLFNFERRQIDVHLAGASVGKHDTLLSARRGTVFKVMLQT
jgi:hypothetical protein